MKTWNVKKGTVYVSCQKSRFISHFLDVDFFYHVDYEYFWDTWFYLTSLFVTESCSPGIQDLSFNDIPIICSVYRITGLINWLAQATFDYHVSLVIHMQNKENRKK